MADDDKAIIRSLRRSKVRVVILLFIAQNYYGQANLKQLRKGLNICASNLLGALIGVQGRYSYQDSLVGLGLLERVETSIEGHKMIHYRITEKGLRIARMLQNEPTTAAIRGELKAY